MKKALLGLVLAGLSTGCEKEKKSDQEAAADKSSTINVDLDEMALNLAGSSDVADAYVLSATLQCPDKTMPLTFTANNQSVVIFHDIRNCDLELASFALEFTNGDTNVYMVTGRQSQGFDVFEAEDNGQVIDTRLAMGMVEHENLCAPSSDCRYDSVTATFTYSELIKEDLIIENDIAISDLDVSIEAEPAPWCDVTAAFEQVDWEAPELVIDFSNCIQLLANDTLELTVTKHNPSMDMGIEALHTLINGDTTTIVNASTGFELRYTIADLQGLAGSSDLLEALTLDLNIAIRNKDGKSIKFLTLDNECEVNI